MGKTWIASCGRSEVYAHELGHNMTMMHSSTDPEDDATVNCEYCDVSDIMGYAGYGLRHTNAPHKDQMGWIPAAKVLTPTASGVYQIAPLSTQPQNTPYPLTIKIGKPGTTTSYYFSFRRRQGYDSNLHANYNEMLNVHSYSGGIVRTMHLRSLADGASFTDPSGQITATLLSRAADHASVQISLAGAPAPTRSAPAVTLAPATQTAAPGATVSYSVTVKNQDGTGAPASTFALTPGFPSGWTGNVTPTSLTLQPGQNGTATLYVTSPTGATSDNNTVGVTAKNSDIAVHNASASAVYAVQAPTTTAAAPTVGLSPAAQTAPSGTAVGYTFTVTNRDSTGSAASAFALTGTVPSGWTSSMTPSSITLQPGQSGSVTLLATSPAGASGGTYSIGARARNSAVAVHDVSASATYAVEAPAPVAPSIGLSPSTQSALAGSTLSYAVSVTNRDAAGSPASTFALTSAVPSGWSGSVSPSSVTLQPGQSGTATLSVVSASGTAAANYTVGATARNSAVAVHTASASAVYGVQTAAPAPVTPSISASPSSRSGNPGDTRSYSVTVTNRDSAGSPASTFAITANATNGWSTSCSPSSLTLQPGQSGTATLAVTSSASAGAMNYAIAITAKNPSVNVHSASTSVSYSVQSVPVLAAPTVTLSPATQSARAGTQVSYTVTVTNRDSAGSPVANFSLTPSVPSGWAASLSASSLSIAPGGSVSVTLRVTSPSGAASGSYTLAANVAEAGVPVHSASGSATYQVQADVTVQPLTAPWGLKSVVKPNNVALSWNTSTGGVAPITYNVYRNGALFARTTDPYYTDTPASGKYTYYVTATDAAGTTSAATFTVTAGVKGSTKGT